jgi:hypothetical protein
MIVNNRPFTNENGWTDDGLLNKLDSESAQTVLNWIRCNIHPRKTVNPHYSSYGLKHLLEHDTGIYLTNNQFKDAMLQCGFRPKDPNELNWTYRISIRKKVAV